MQRVAAYILERTRELRSPSARTAEGNRLRAVVEAWLESKGSTAVDGWGKYAAVDGSDACYQVTTAREGNRSSRMFELSEVTPEGRRFVTTVSVTVGHASVVVFVTMEVGSVSTSVTRMDVDPKCPKVVRDLLAQRGAWHHGPSRLRGLSKVQGFEAGEGLALDILGEGRTIPYVVVSRVRGRTALPRLGEKLASDLAGVANVFSVDEQASRALTDALRKGLSTQGGALRIYWPRLTVDDAPFRHQLWSGGRLRSIEADPSAALGRIRRQLRSIVMRASAVSVVPPAEIDDIRGAAARAEYAALRSKADALEGLKARASSLEGFKDLADSYAADSDELRSTLAARDAEVERLRDELRRSKADNQALVFRLGQASSATELEPDAPDHPETDQPPKPGDVRFYKKTHSRPGYDVLIRVGDCGHTAWQIAGKADKAKKGLARLLGEDREWKKLEHCGSCRGGGLWRVGW